MRSRYADRRDAGRALAAELRDRITDDGLLIVLGLPRGGVVVAAEVAAVLKAELDALVVRKLGVPGHEELAVGAVAAGAEPVVNEDVRRRAAISAEVIGQLATEQLAECARREAVYRPGQAPIDVTGREVVLVDDGLATGATMRAAVRVLPALGPPRRVIVAVPVGPRDTVDELAAEADEVVCLATPRPFLAVGYAYDDFRQTTDDEVRDLLVYPFRHTIDAVPAARPRLPAAPLPPTRPPAGWRQPVADRIDTIVSLSKRRGFVYPSSEIYGGTRSAWDYGPLGVELKENIRRQWWRTMVQGRDDIVGIDSAVILAREVWEASGHVDAFVDPLTECQSCHQRFRADQLEEAYEAKHRHAPAHGLADVNCPNCGVKGAFTEPRMFNGLLRTYLGPVESDEGLHYLRPETAQGIFVNFRQRDGVARARSRRSASRRSASRSATRSRPGNFIFRTREFEQMEMEFFVEPGTDEEWHEYWLQERWDWYVDLGRQAGQPALLRAPARRSSRTTRSAPSTSSTASSSAAPSSPSSRASPTAPTST